MAYIFLGWPEVEEGDGRPVIVLVIFVKVGLIEWLKRLVKMVAVQLGGVDQRIVNKGTGSRTCPFVDTPGAVVHASSAVVNPDLGDPNDPVWEKFFRNKLEEMTPSHAKYKRQFMAHFHQALSDPGSDPVWAAFLKKIEDAPEDYLPWKKVVDEVKAEARLAEGDFGVAGDRPVLAADEAPRHPRVAAGAVSSRQFSGEGVSSSRNKATGSRTCPFVQAPSRQTGKGTPVAQRLADEPAMAGKLQILLMILPYEQIIVLGIPLDKDDPEEAFLHAASPVILSEQVKGRTIYLMRPTEQGPAFYRVENMRVAAAASPIQTITEGIIFAPLGSVQQEDFPQRTVIDASALAAP